MIPHLHSMLRMLRLIGAVTLGAAAGMFLRIFLASESFSTQTQAATSHSAPHVGPFPLSLVVANILGTLILIAVTREWQKGEVSPHMRLMVATGFCGSLTSYSGMVVALTPGITSPEALLVNWSNLAELTWLVLWGSLGTCTRWALTHGYIARYSRERNPRGLPALLSHGLPPRVRHRTSSYRALYALVATAWVNLAATVIAAVSYVLAGGSPGLWAFLSATFIGCMSTFSTAIVDAWKVWRAGGKLLAALALVTVFLLSTLVCAATVAGTQWLISA